MGSGSCLRTVLGDVGFEQQYAGVTGGCSVHQFILPNGARPCLCTRCTSAAILLIVGLVRVKHVDFELSDPSQLSRAYYTALHITTENQCPYDKSFMTTRLQTPISIPYLPCNLIQIPNRRPTAPTQAETAAVGIPTTTT